MKLDLHYSKDPLQNLRQRANLIQQASKNKKLRAAIIQACQSDILFFVDLWCWTYNPKLDDPNIPFVSYEFQKRYFVEIVECIELGKDSFTEKSREMGFSWMLTVVHVWGFLFKGWSSLYGSYKEDYVDSRGNMDAFFERVRYVLNRLPKWMKPADLLDKYMNISSQSLNCAISGDTGENFGTGGRRKFVTMDEFALWANDEKAFRKTRDIANCRIFGGTPEGRFNIYGKVMTKHKDYVHLDVKRFRLHWREHPLKTQEWYDAECKKRTKLDIAKELDISYDDSVTGAVYKDFAHVAKFDKYEFNPKLRLFTSWDFGRDMTAIIWFQKDFDNDLIYVIDAYQKEDMDIDFFTAFVTGQMVHGFEYNEEERDMIQKHYNWTHAYSNHYGDPYNGDSRSGVTTDTFKTKLAEYGINLQLKTGTTLEGRIRDTTLAIRRMCVDDRLTDFIQAIIQSRYPQQKENSQNVRESKKPIHDVNSHFRTALEYAIDNVPISFTSGESKGVNAAQSYADRISSLRRRK